MESTPTQRELDILRILWDRGEATVRDVYEQLRDEADIVQNTVQAMLRTMEEKGQVTHYVSGRAFVYKPRLGKEKATRKLTQNLLDTVFNGAVDQLVDSVFSLRDPSAEELRHLEELITAKKKKSKSSKRK